MRLLLAIACALCLAVPALAENGIQADFEAGINDGGWNYGGDVVESDGGNPGGWLHSAVLDVPYPLLYCDYLAAGWTGDYVAMGVTGFHLDVQTVYTGQPYFGEYNVLVFLRMVNDPDTIDDDVFVYYDPYAYAPPMPGDGWVTYTWDIPADFVGAPGELPENWRGGSIATGNTVFPPDMTWQEVLSDVGRLEVWFLDPDYFAIFAMFEMGADNITLVYDQGSVATEPVTMDGIKALYR